MHLAACIIPSISKMVEINTKTGYSVLNFLLILCEFSKRLRWLSLHSREIGDFCSPAQGLNAPGHAICDTGSILPAIENCISEKNVFSDEIYLRYDSI